MYGETRGGVAMPNRRRMLRAALIPSIAAAMMAAPSSSTLASSGWQIVPSVHPSGVAGSEWLSDVAMSSATKAWAVGGWYDSARAEHDLLARWNGTAWTTVGIPNPGGSSPGAVNELTAVSTAPHGTVFAVGSWG